MLRISLATDCRDCARPPLVEDYVTRFRALVYEIPDMGPADKQANSCED